MSEKGANTVKAKFLSKKEREALALARLRAKREDQEKKLEDARSAHESFVNGMNIPSGGTSTSAMGAGPRDHKGAALSSSSSSLISSSGAKQAKGKQKQDSDVPSGAPPAVKKQKTEKSNDPFKADWEATEDTSREETDPLYGHRMQFKTRIGRGRMAGQDDEFGEKPTVKGLSKSGGSGIGKSSSGTSSRSSNGDEMEGHWSKKKLESMTERDWRIFREDFDIRVSGHGGIRHMISPLRYWREGGFPQGISKAIDKLGYQNPSPIQRQAIPALHGARQDIIGIAETGSGKTAAFLVPLLCHMSTMEASILSKCSEEGPVGLVIAPTRELAIQIEDDCRSLAQFTAFKSTCLVGGESIDAQIATLRASSVHVVVGTPGRLADCVDNNYMVLNQCQYVVLDEADKMVDMGFEAALTAILDSIPGARVNELAAVTTTNEDHPASGTRDSGGGGSSGGGGGGGGRVMAMFSATMPPQVERIARTYLQRPLTIRIGDVVSMKNTRIKQTVRYLQESQKKDVAVSMLRRMGEQEKSIVFVNSKKQVDLLGKVLESHRVRVATLHGGKSQDQRNDALNAFRENAVRVLVATDVAGRGLDISDVTHVLNYECPQKLEAYTHRIGRTGRAGRSGEAVTLVSDVDKAIFGELASYILDCDPKASLPGVLTAARKGGQVPHMRMN